MVSQLIFTGGYVTGLVGEDIEMFDSFSAAFPHDVDSVEGEK